VAQPPDGIRWCTGTTIKVRPKPLRAIDVPCPFCEVSAGTACKRIRLHVNWSNAHAERRETARLVTNARDALTD
jgi:hypothetical protein